MKTETESVKRPLIYITRDIERALGMEPGPSGERNYFIITNRTPYAEIVAAKYPENVWLVGDNLLDTHEILSLPEVVASITKSTTEQGAEIIVFKNTERIEAIANEHGWKLVNPSASLAEQIENKITQVEWLGELASYLPSHKIQIVNEIEAAVEFTPFILQWAHSHTGDGTILVTTEKQLSEIKQKFPQREARMSTYIKGPTFTANVIAGADGEMAHQANISYQITGSLPFTDNPWSTIGNDWSLTHSLLTEKNIADIHEIAQKISIQMYRAGWRGLFGIDVIYDEERDQIYLIEINARQPASTTFESQLQLGLRVAGIEGATTFENHIHALTDINSTKQGEDSSPTLIPVSDGAQIVQRVTQASVIKEISTQTKNLDDTGFITITYPNTKINSDLIRIQHIQGIMETHNKFNKRGKQILEFLK